MNLEEFKAACAALSVEYSETRSGEPTIICRKLLQNAIVWRFMRKAARAVADSDDPQFEADYRFTQDLLGMVLPKALDYDLDLIGRDLKMRELRLHRKGCPYTIAQYDAALEKAGTNQKRLAAELGVDRKTLRRHGRPQGH
jgi:hypothetical protein